MYLSPNIRAFSLIIFLGRLRQFLFQKVNHIKLQGILFNRIQKHELENLNLAKKKDAEYNRYLIYIPTNLAEDSAFPLKEGK